MKKISLFILTLVVIANLFSCSSSNYDRLSVEDGSLLGDASSYNETEATEQKIIYSAYLSLVVKDPDETNNTIEEITKKYDGYIHEIGTYRTIIRVKSDQLDNAVKEIATLGKLKHKSISGKDVTGEYADTKIRLENAQKLRKRYLELLEKAQNVEETLLVEKELARINEEIDLLKGRSQRIDHLSEFSTIDIDLKRKRKPGLIGYIGIGVYKAVKWLFVRN